MANYAGKVILVVNTSSHCGFTLQYVGLEALYRKYASQGPVILVFPCNHFGKQEPGGTEEISQTCYINYSVSFPVFEKEDVNGATAHPVFRYLKRELLGVLGGKIKWNFTKFLIGRDGKPLKRFAPISIPENRSCNPYCTTGLRWQANDELDGFISLSSSLESPVLSGFLLPTSSFLINPN